LKVSVIDLGYNSLKLVNYKVRRDKAFVAYGQQSVLAKVGEGLDQTGFLGDKPIRRTIKALRQFRAVVDLEQSNHVLPVATSAVREAGNKEEFLKQAYQETGFKFKVLSEKEEAVYAFEGAKSATSVHAGLFFDLGGGSLEMVIYSEPSIRKILSVPLGGLRLTDLYAKPGGSYTKKNYARMRKRILELLPEKKHLPASKNLELVGVGGSVRALARYDQMRREYPLNKLHNYLMKKNAVESVHRALRGMSLRTIRKNSAIGQERSQSIIAGSLVVHLLMEKIGFRKLIVSTHGLRDGVLSAFLESPRDYRQGLVDRVLLRKGTQTPIKASAQEKLARSLLSHRKLTRREFAILSEALNHVLPELPIYNPETLFYVVLEADSVLSHQDQLIMALSVARANGMRRTDWAQTSYKRLLDKNSMEMVKKISVLLQLAQLQRKTNVNLSLRSERGIPRLHIAQGKRSVPKVLVKDILKDLEDLEGTFNLQLAL
jgi:exopolyphosphatase / guanosine-5'-triphosphate,3'-diphosphate pyrophosphatase